MRGWSTRTTETRSLWCILWTCIVGRRIVPTGRIILLIGLCALWFQSIKALRMSSSQAINNLKHHYLVLPANRPERSIYVGDIIGNLSGAADWYTAIAVPWRVFIPQGVDSRKSMLSNENQTKVSLTSHGGWNTPPNESILSRTASAMPVSISIAFS